MAENSTTILIVDDLAENLRVLSGLLSAEHRVLAATSGEAALRIANGENKPDLILLDVMMPKMDGYEVLRQLKRNQATQTIPVIFVTALADEQDEEHGLRLGAVDYITKPIKPMVVMARVSAQLQAKQARDWLKKQK